MKASQILCWLFSPSQKVPFKSCHYINVYAIVIFFLELEKAKGFPDPIVLDLTGQFMWHFRKIPAVGKRLEYHSTCFSWFSVASNLGEQVAVLNTACATMNVSSNKLQQLFSM